MKNNERDSNKILGKVIKDFEGKSYVILNIASHTETGINYIIYKLLDKGSDIYMMPLGLFMSKIDEKSQFDIVG